MGKNKTCKSSLPDKRERRQKKRDRIITVDLDGTVADISHRREHALKFGEEGSPSFYDVLLDPELFNLDIPIIPARDFLCAYVSEAAGEVVYLSGRRIGTERDSLEWLIQRGFPEGRVIHRKTGRKSADFKKECLESLSREFRIDGHFGDREIDDRGSAESVGVRYFHIDNYQWPNFSQLRPMFIKEVTGFTEAIDSTL
jgi:predicted secreted acid phosphatase